MYTIKFEYGSESHEFKSKAALKPFLRDVCHWDRVHCLKPYKWSDNWQEVTVQDTGTGNIAYISRKGLDFTRPTTGV